MHARKLFVRETGGPISVMLAEHQAERELLGRLVQPLPALDPEGATARQTIVYDAPVSIRDVLPDPPDPAELSELPELPELR